MVLMMSSDDYTEIGVYSYLDPKNKIGVLQNATSVQGLQEITGNGAGQLTIAKNDPALLDTPAILDTRNIFKLSCGNDVRSAFVLINRDETQIDTGEESSEAVNISGDGPKMLLGDIQVYPANGKIIPTSPEDRVFSWASPRGIWYDASQWVVPTEVEKYGMLRTSPNRYWKYQPAEWPDAPNAYWVWSELPQNGLTRAGDVFLRTEFDVTEENAGSYSLFIAGDNQYQAFIDASVAVEATGTGNYFAKVERYDFDLEAGTHVLAIRGRQNARKGKIGAGPAGIIAVLFKAGDADAGTKAEIIRQTGGGNWRIMGYPAEEPGWSVGEILLQLLKEGRDRGIRSASWFTPTFTEIVDSNGVAWANHFPYSFNVGDSLIDVLEQMEELEVETWIDPDTFEFNVTQKRGKDLSLGAAPVTLQEGWNLTKAGTTGEADITNKMLMKTDDGWIVVQDNVSVEKYGPIEGQLTTTANSSQSKKLAQKIFSIHANTEEGSTYELIPREGAEPFKDFSLGDWVLAPNKDGVLGRRRVMSIAIQTDAAGNPLYAVEFDTILQTKQKQYDRMAALASGSGLGAGFAFASSNGGSGVGSPVTSEGAAARPQPPAAPENVSVTSVGKFSATTGDPQAVATVSWDFVSLAEDGTALRGIKEYRVYGRLGNAADTDSTLFTTVGGSYSTAKISGLRADEDYLFWVVALVDADRFSEDSDAVAHHTAVPPSAMFPPTVPTLVTKLGTITASWDGKMNNGQVIPKSVLYVFAEFSTTATGTYTTIGNTIASASTIVLTGLTVGNTYYVRFRARDKAGNTSNPSGVASIVVDGVDATDLGQEFQDRIDAIEQVSEDAQSHAAAAQSAAEAAAKAAQDAAESSGSIVYQEDEPAVEDRGRLWIKPSTKKSYLWNGASNQWEEITDPDIAEAARKAGEALEAATQAAGTADNAAQQAGQALMAANGKSRVWYLPNAPVAPASGHTVDDTWFDTDDENKAYRWTGTVWEPRLLGNAAFSGVDAGKITTGFLDTARLQANSITSRLLAVGDFKEYLENNSFEDTTSVSKWSFPDATSIIDGTIAHTGTKSAKFTVVSAAKKYYYIGGDIPVTEGQTFGFTMWVRRDTSYNGTAAGAFTGFVNASNNAVLSQNGLIHLAAIPAVSTWMQVTATVVVPAGVTLIRPFVGVNHTTGSLWIDDVSTKVQLGGTLIADGAVTTNKVAANAIKANNLDVGAVTAVSIATDAVTTDKLDANAINAKHTLTGPLIRTAVSGARTEMTNQGIQVLDTSGSTQVRLGYGIDTGMSVLDRSGRMVPIGNQLFGAAGVTRDQDERVTNGSETAWGATTEVPTGLVYNTPTGRAFLQGTLMTADNQSYQDYQYRFWLRLYRRSTDFLLTNTYMGYFGGLNATSWTYIADQTSVAGEDVVIRLAIQSRKTYGATGNAYVGKRTTFALPI